MKILWLKREKKKWQLEIDQNLKQSKNWLSFWFTWLYSGWPLKLCEKVQFFTIFKISSSKTTFFHIFTIFYYGIKQEIKYITIILVPNYDNLWNSAANTIISSLEWYLGFCSVNLVLGHFHGVYYELLVVHIYLLSTKTILYNIRS